MQPYKVFLFTLFLFLCAGVFVCFSPCKKICLSSQFCIRFPQKQDIIPAFKSYPQPIATEVKPTSPPIYPTIKIDSITLASSDFDNISAFPIEYNDSISHPLQNFYQSLRDQEAHPEILRILHYGDSQIEGDRISKTFRKYMQTCFGGTGVGALPLFSSAPIDGINVKKSSNLLQMEMIKQKRRGNFGLYNAYFYSQDIFSPNAPASSIQITFEKKQIYKDSLELYLLTHETLTSNEVSVKINKQPHTLFAKEKKLWGLATYTYKVPPSLQHIQMEIQQGKNNHIYGLSLQSTQGVIVDNIPVRGSSGNIFINNNRQFLTTNYNLMNVKFIIYQFGINAIPQNPNTLIPDYSYYEKMIYSELIYLQSLFPELPILVVSTSDRSRKNGLNYETNPNIYKVVNAQRKAALAAHCAFWDLFSAMGGENSIYLWSTLNPSLANKDFIHFSSLGAEKVGKMLYKSLILDYERYLNKTQAHE